MHTLCLQFDLPMPFNDDLTTAQDLIWTQPGNDEGDLVIFIMSRLPVAWKEPAFLHSHRLCEIVGNTIRVPVSFKDSADVLRMEHCEVQCDYISTLALQTDTIGFNVSTRTMVGINWLIIVMPSAPLCPVAGTHCCVPLDYMHF